MALLYVGAMITALVAKKRSPKPSPLPPDLDTTVTFDTGGDAFWPAILFAGGLAVILLIAYLSYRSKQRRRTGFMTMARQLGLTYSLEDPFGLLGYPFALFQRGDGRGIENVVHGAWQETNVIAFDYWYYEETSDGKSSSRTYYRFDCAIVPIDADCTRLEIGQENVLSRLAGALSFRDLQFESEAFNDAFKVSCDDPKFANDLIDGRMMQWLLEHAAGYGFELVGNRVLVVGPKIDPSALIGLLGVSRGFVQHVPRVVYSLYPG